MLEFGRGCFWALQLVSIAVDPVCGHRPSASLDHRTAQAASMHPRAPAEPLGSSPRPQELASGRPKVEAFPLSTSRLVNLLSKDADPAVLVRRSVPPADYPGRMLSARFCPICGGFSQWTPRLAEVPQG